MTLVRSLLGGGASAALLPWIVSSLGGDAASCLRLGGAFALGTLLSEVPAALVGDRIGRARPFFLASSVSQAVGLAGIALARSIPALAVALGVLGVGAGLATGAEGRASLSIGGDARAVARLEVSALLGKGFVACAIAVIATVAWIGAAPAVCARSAVALSALGSLLAAPVAATLRRSDRVRATRKGRRDPRRAAARDRRRWWSFGVVALIAGVAFLGLTARGTDTIDAFAVLTRGAGVIAGAAILASKGLIARLLAPQLARRRAVAVALAAFFAAVLLVVSARCSTLPMLVCVAMACGVAGGAAAAGRGVLLARVGGERAGLVAAAEATLRRGSIALGALGIATIHASPYVVAAAVACIGGVAVLSPRVLVSIRGPRARKPTALVGSSPAFGGASVVESDWIIRAAAIERGRG